MCAVNLREPAASILLPVRNGKGFLSLAIESALSQNFEDFELLISDDNSSDGSEEIIAHYASQDKRIRWWRNHEALGLFANYNRCLSQAQGTYIKPFAQDDLWAASLLSQQINFFRERRDVALVSAQRIFIDAVGRSLAASSNGSTIVDLLGRLDVYQPREVVKACLFPITNLIGEPCTVMFRREHYGSGFSPVFQHMGDLEYWLRILRHGKLGMIHEPLVYYRHHPESTTQRNLRKLFVHTDIIHMAEAITDLLKDFNCSHQEFITQNLTRTSADIIRLQNGNPDLDALMGADDYQLSDIIALKKSFVYLLNIVGAKAGVTPKITKEEQKIIAYLKIIKVAEARLHKILDSFSWRITRPFREINKFLLKTDEQTYELRKYDDFDSLTQHEAYLDYLNKTIQKIFESRSWQFTNILRKDDLAWSMPTQLIVQQKKENHQLIKTGHEHPTAINGSQWQISSHPYILPADKNSVLDRRYDLVLAVHDATRTGAPMLALTLCKQFTRRGFNCLVVLKSGGPLVAEFTNYCDTLNLSQAAATDDFLNSELERLLGSGKLLASTPVFLNTAEFHDLSHIFKRHGFYVISLIHEYLSNYPKIARDEILWNSDITVFSAKATYDDAHKHGSFISGAKIIPQGLLNPDFGSTSKEEGKQFLLENCGISEHSFVILACGTSDQRKGIDLFTLVALNTLNCIDKQNVHFIWIGGHTPNTFDSFWWAKYDTKQSGIASRVHFVGAQTNLEPYFAGSDLFLMCSRQDPMPCVLHMAQATGLPVVAFQGSGGAEDVLQHGGGKLVGYGDIRAMSNAIQYYFADKSLRSHDGAVGKKIVSTTYNIDTYAEQLLQLAHLSSSFSYLR